MKGRTYFTVVAYLLVGLYSGGSLGAACEREQVTAEAASKAYAAEQVACVQKHSTLEAAQKCREEVRAKWGVYEDGGRRD